MTLTLANIHVISDLWIQNTNGGIWFGSYFKLFVLYMHNFTLLDFFAKEYNQLWISEVNFSCSLIG